MPIWLIPSRHWSVRRAAFDKNAIVQKLVEIAHTDEDGIVHEQTAIAARSLTEMFLNLLSIANRATRRAKESPCHRTVVQMSLETE